MNKTPSFKIMSELMKIPVEVRECKSCGFQKLYYISDNTIECPKCKGLIFRQ